MPARVLVVTAQHEIQIQVGDTLRRDGHEILVGNDGQEALRAWSSDRPDLIVLDEDLRDGPGLNVLARIRKAEVAPAHTPVVLVGSSGDVGAKVAALRAGADEYLAVPVHPQELSARVRGLL